MKKYLLLIIILISSPAYAVDLQYCQCSDKQPSVQEKLNMSYAVFTGTVDRIRREINPDRIKVTFKISNSWKGIRNNQASVYTDVSDVITTVRNANITCGYQFRQGESYLVYSDRNKNARGPSWVSSCGDVIPLSEAGSDIQYLNGLDQIELKSRR